MENFFIVPPPLFRLLLSAGRLSPRTRRILREIAADQGAKDEFGHRHRREHADQYPQGQGHRKALDGPVPR